MARGRPDTCTPDPGAKFTRQEFLVCAVGARVRVSIGRRVRRLVNDLVERLCLTVNCREI